MDTSTGFCPYCGDPIAIQSYGYYRGKIENIDWEPCSNLCKGSMKTIRTDLWGFVILPEELKDHYIYSRRHTI